MVEQGKAVAFGNRTKLLIYAAKSQSGDATRVLDRHFTAEPVAFPCNAAMRTSGSRSTPR
jgi:hypothetical protein